MPGKYKISMDRRVIKLLGEHLYGDAPSVLNELVANAYDARADNVWITVKTTEPYQIIVEDDGIGMNVDDINNYFLNIGYNRRLKSDLQEQLRYIERDDMGQKGIGKLAVFALSHIVNVYSKKIDSDPIGCQLDFNIITKDDGEPSDLTDASEKITRQKGTKIELTNVTKNLAKSYRFLASSLSRAFFMNTSGFHIHIQRNSEGFKELKRSELNLFHEMDTLITFGNTQKITEIIAKVENNSIEEKFKTIQKYSDIQSQRNFIELPTPLNIYDKDKQNILEMSFNFDGWIGTVRDSESFKNILLSSGYEESDLNDKEIIVSDDNRISIYSRGKIGEYNILSKVKSNGANDAYLIGELYVDDFEKTGFTDMATSNRRGYQEDDPRYEMLIKIVKSSVSRVISNKQRISRLRKEEQEQQEAAEIQNKFEQGQNESSEVFKNMSQNDKSKVEKDFFQYSRAVTLKKSTKKIFISHKSYQNNQGSPANFYGKFLLDIITEIDLDLGKETIFTSHAANGVPKGDDIIDYLKSCFRDDLFVVFIFTKSFYDSNMCIAEAGAAWATNKRYSVITVDLPFSDIDKPLNQTQSGTALKWPLNTDTKIHLEQEIKHILDQIDFNYSSINILEKIDFVIDKYTTDSVNNDTPSYIPYRKHQFYPKCSICGKRMKLSEFSGSVKYICEDQTHNFYDTELF